MKILVNATNLVVGGGVQVATSFIVEAVRRAEPDIEWTFCVSRAVAENVRKILGSGWEGEVFEQNPNHIRAGKAARERLSQISEAVKPDLIFTVFGPFWKKFAGRFCGQPTAHLCGCAVCWSTHPNRLVYDKIGLIQTLKRKVRRIWDFLCLRRAQYFWIELDIAREGLKRGAGTDDAHIRTIGNTCAQVFHEAPKVEADFSGKEIRLLVMGAPYVHKNFEIVPDVLAALKKQAPGRRFVFTLTAPESGNEWKNIKERAEVLGVGDGVRTVGKVALTDCPKLYSDNHIVFMPTLLETFSATYPEAMAMRRAIVTTDLDFAHSICGNAAVYYSPLDATDAAAKILRVVENPELRDNLIAEGGKVLSALPSPQEKYEQLVAYMREIVAKETD